MLQHEQTDPQTVLPTISLPVPSAADARVTPDELNAALKALEDQQNSTVAIGSVVDELRLNATSEQIWEQVQRQRAQQAAEAAPKPQVQTVSAQQVRQPKIGRQVRRGWRHSKGWLWVIFWCTGGFGLLAGLPHWLHHQPPGIVVSGDGVKGDYQVKGTGSQRDVTVTGDGDKITVHGNVRVLTVDGDDEVVAVDGSVQGVRVHGDNSKVHWTKDNEAGFPVEPYEVSGDNTEASQSRP